MTDDPKNEKLEVNMSLDEWLDILNNTTHSTNIIDYEFPTDHHREEYLARIQSFTEQDIHKLLNRFLIPSCSLGSDMYYLRSLVNAKRTIPEMFNSMIKLKFSRRLIAYAQSSGKAPPPWEGITWILDLLPHFPMEAIRTLEGYILAHAQLLPDGRFRGLSESLSIIRARYIGTPGTQPEKVAFLTSMNSRDFEYLILRLYRDRGYKAELTQPTRDGGRDIIGSKDTIGEAESILVDCKCYTKPVSVKAVREMLGVVSDEKKNKGVIITSSRFTLPAIKFAKRNPRIELIDGKLTVVLLNQYLGSSWPDHIDRIILEAKRDEISSNSFKK